MDRTLIEALPGTSLLRQVSKETLGVLLDRAVERTVERGRTLYKQGDPGDSMAVVISGLFKLYVVTARGREVVIGFVSPGGAVGEIAVFDAQPRTATVEASETSRVLVFQSRDVRNAIAHDGTAALKVIDLLCQRLRRSNIRVEDDAATTLEPKLSRAILRVVRELEDGGAVARTVVPLRQSDLAAYAGVSRENVNRQLQKWVEDGLIILSRGKLKILDLPHMQALGEDDE